MIYELEELVDAANSLFADKQALNEFCEDWDINLKKHNTPVRFAIYIADNGYCELVEDLMNYFE